MWRRLKRLLGSMQLPLNQPLLDEARRQIILDEKSAPATKAAQRLLFHHYRTVDRTSLPTLRESGFRNFSQFEEDGKLLFIFAQLGVSRGTFIDIGSADGINSNCANLAINFGWTGVFIDGEPGNIEIGRRFYEKHADTWAYPPKFVQAMVTRENINDVLRAAGAVGTADFMSIDIDGNDYWVWDAIDCVMPSVVMIETHIEFGLRSIVVPYDPNYRYPGKHPDYHGASVPAMEKLARRKGYRLVGANDYGFNTIYVRNGLAEDRLPAVDVASVLAHPRNAERAKRFDAIQHFEYLEV